MDITYFFVDFENVQPPDLGLLGDPGYRLKLFHGPHQNKLDMDIVKALQPLGDKVDYIQSDRHGKNALDFHVAFYIGRLLERHQSNGKTARFVVVSKDRDFEPLLAHVRALGYVARQVVTIRDALAVGPETITAAPIPAVDRLEIQVAAPLVAQQSQPDVLTTQVARQSAWDERQPVPTLAPMPKKSAAGVSVIDKVLENLRKHPNNRPARLETLERHIATLLGGIVSKVTVQGVVAELVHRKIVAFKDKKVSYSIKAKK